MKFVQSDDSAFPVRQHCAAASIKLHNTKRPARPSPAYELHVFVDPHAAPPALPAHSSTKRPRTPLLTPPWPQTSSARPRISYSAPFHSSPTETPCPDTPPESVRPRHQTRQGANHTAYLGTTLSSSPLRASNASRHRLAHRHHLQPPLRPIWRRSLPCCAENVRNSSVSSAARTAPLVSCPAPHRLVLRPFVGFAATHQLRRGCHSRWAGPRSSRCACSPSVVSWRRRRAGI